MFRGSVRAALSGLDIFASIALLTMIIVTAWDVMGRVLFSAPLGFAYELVGILLGCSVYGGLSRVNWQQEHIRIDLLESSLKGFRSFEVFRKILTRCLEIVFYSILAIYIFRQMLSLLKWQETFLFLPLEKWMPVAVFGGLVALSAVAVIASAFPIFKSKGEK
ncbi:TRAP transporter small permease [uncultured Thalassospira sp.]|uniref:TRAP transporter small permease n=1 Tax=uncultured Thalassospira sp. TaxID=404382 RepID=UPI00258DE508|nr:TRAP transporter small permease [uncultured Thalassospira sp.]